jgi:hypothetical protein
MNSGEFPHAHVDGLLASLLYFSRALIIYFADAQTCGKHLLISIYTHGSPFGDIVNARERHKESASITYFNQKAVSQTGDRYIVEKLYTLFALDGSEYFRIMTMSHRI